jgi:hypothetical protein
VHVWASRNDTSLAVLTRRTGTIWSRVLWKLFGVGKPKALQGEGGLAACAASH